MKKELTDQAIERVKSHLLKERDRSVRSVIGIGHREIAQQLITDLYSLPGSGGSDERTKAREWFFREVGLFCRRGDNLNRWGEMQDVIDSFHEPYQKDIEELAAKLGLGMSR